MELVAPAGIVLPHPRAAGFAKIAPFLCPMLWPR